MLVDAILDRARVSGQRPAVCAQGRTISYAQLAGRAVLFSAELRARGIGRGRLVAIVSDRSPEAIVAMVGTLLAGAAYTFVEGDPQQVRRQIDAIMPDLVVTDPARMIRPRSEDALIPGLARPAQRAADDIAYVLFTSGSTGAPKGVMVTHGNVDHYTQAIGALTAVPDGLRFAHVSTLAADLGNTALFLSLSTGGCLHLVDEPTRRDAAALFDYLRDEAIQFLKITPSHWHAISAALDGGAAELPGLTHLVFGGEALRKETVAGALRRCRAAQVFNHYGPTETTVGAAAFAVGGAEALAGLAGSFVPIGRPLGHTTLWVRTERGELANRGATGELWIGGPSVAAGYRGLEEATRERFVLVERSAAPPMRCYRSGDLVELRDDGTAVFLGRVDRQVKIRGHRVELEGIEHVLRSVEGVVEASVALVDIGGRQRLLAAVQGAPGHCLQPAALRRQAAALLPGHMRPHRIWRFDALPRNANGKLDLRALTGELTRRLAGERNACGVGHAAGHDEVSQLQAAITAVFSKYVSPAQPDPTESFYELGGDSLDAIQMIGELQYSGLDVSGADFSADPTISGLLQSALRRRGRDSSLGRPAATRTQVDRFSAAQQRFFHAGFEEENHYNQAILLRFDEPIDELRLGQALEQAVANHCLLRTAFEANGEAPSARVLGDAPAPVLTVSTLDEGAGAAAEAAIAARAEVLQRSLRLRDGIVFKAHLFKARADAHLLLLAHHLCVDVVSWRILCSELTRCYCDLRDGLPPTAAASRGDFWDWVQHLPADDAAMGCQAQEPSVAHRESDTQTCWWAYTRAQSLALEAAAARRRQPLHLLLLAALAHECARQTGQRRVVIDVEQHGRDCQEDAADASRTVGWHTAISTLAVDVEPARFADTLARTSAALERTGTARTGAQQRCGPTMLYNFIGDASFALDPRISVRPAHFDLGATRGGGNHRTHDLKMTVKKLEGQYIVDLSYPAPAADTDPQRTQRIVAALRTRIDRQLPVSGGLMAGITEAGARTGALHYVPRALIEPGGAAGRRRYRSVLLTGATGYIGVHCLRELLLQTGAQVACLVRADSQAHGRERLCDNWAHYFGLGDWAKFEARIDTLCGDVAQPGLGLSAADHALASGVDAIYHLAADTRLIGAEQHFIETNLQAVRRIVDLARSGRPKDVHYVSTLAVSGVHSGADPVTFTENTLDIGQDFQNSYEKTKFLAEKMLHRAMLDGVHIRIYRAGDVSAHSQSGRFQRNAHANRLVQFLDACARLGALPRYVDELLRLSPVDLVAAAIVSLSLDARQSPETCHVDTPHAVPLAMLFDAMQAEGFAFEATDCESFAALFERSRAPADPRLALGRFWSARRPRNVNYDSRRTLGALRESGHEFVPPTPAWLRSFVRHLVGSGALVAPAAAQRRVAGATPARPAALPGSNGPADIQGSVHA